MLPPPCQESATKLLSTHEWDSTWVTARKRRGRCGGKRGAVEGGGGKCGGASWTKGDADVVGRRRQKKVACTKRGALQAASGGRTRPQPRARGSSRHNSATMSIECSHDVTGNARGGSAARTASETETNEFLSALKAGE